MYKEEIDCFKEFVKIVPSILNLAKDTTVATNGDLALEKLPQPEKWKLVCSCQVLITDIYLIFIGS